MEVDDHPSDNITHPDPGPGRTSLAGSRDKVMGAGAFDLAIQTGKVYGQLGSDMGSMLSGKKYNSSSGNYE